MSRGKIKSEQHMGKQIFGRLFELEVFRMKYCLNPHC